MIDDSRMSLTDINEILTSNQAVTDKAKSMMRTLVSDNEKRALSLLDFLTTSSPDTPIHKDDLATVKGLALTTLMECFDENSKDTLRELSERN